MTLLIERGVRTRQIFDYPVAETSHPYDALEILTKILDDKDFHPRYKEAALMLFDRAVGGLEYPIEIPEVHANDWKNIGELTSRFKFFEGLRIKDSESWKQLTQLLDAK